MTREPDCGHLGLIASGEARGLCPLCLRAKVERLRLAATKAIKTWHRESSPNSIKIYKAMEALERELDGLTAEASSADTDTATHR